MKRIRLLDLRPKNTILVISLVIFLHKSIIIFPSALNLAKFLCWPLRQQHCPSYQVFRSSVRRARVEKGQAMPTVVAAQTVHCVHRPRRDR